MALLQKKARGSGGPPSRQFYVEFLGCLPCNGIRGSIYTNVVAHELIQRKYHYPNVPKMTLQLSPNDIKISHENSEGHRKEKITSKYPCLMMRNITYATCMTAPNADIATCIYFAYNRATESPLHTHVYRFDSPETASTFIDLINMIVESPQHQSNVSTIEQDLRQRGYLQPTVGIPPPSASYWQEPLNNPPIGAPAYEFKDPEREPHNRTDIQQSMQKALNNELKQKLNINEAPILLPPKDYDTIHRKQGRLSDISSRKSLNAVLVGRTSVEAAISASGNKLLLDEDRTTEPKKSPIYYPAKITSNSGLNSPTSTGSPVIYRRKQQENSNSSFLSNSSGGSDTNYRRSHTPPKQSSPPPVGKHRHQSAYELYPTLKNTDRSPMIDKHQDMVQRNSSHHTRQSSMSSTHSGLSSHSDPFLRANDPDLEVPPDYHGGSEMVNSSDLISKDGGNLRYSNPNYYEQYQGHGNQVANRENAYPPHSFNSVQYDDAINKLYAKPIKRTGPIQ